MFFFLVIVKSQLVALRDRVELFTGSNYMAVNPPGLPILKIDRDDMTNDIKVQMMSFVEKYLLTPNNFNIYNIKSLYLAT